MNRFTLTLTALALLSFAAPTHADEVLRAGLESPFVHDAGDGLAQLGVLLSTRPEDLGEATPIALALVVDSSGSMNGLKIEHARHAARTMVNALGANDRVAIHDFDSVVRQVAPLSRVDASARTQLLRAIDGLEADGHTALFGGLVAGIESLGETNDATRRVLLLSDGLANVGPSTAADIVAGLPKSDQPTTLSTVGIGTDYDEQIMMAVARHGGGGFHHLTDPVQLAGILAEELKQARGVAGTEAVVEIRPAPGVEVLSAVGLNVERLGSGDCGPALAAAEATRRLTADLVDPPTPDCRRVRIRVGDLLAGETRALALKVRVPTDGARQRSLGEVKLTYRARRDSAVVARRVPVNYVLTASLAQVKEGEVPAFMVAADRTRVAHVLVDAAALLKEGDVLEAQALLRDERTRLLKRVERLDGAAKSEAESLVAMFRDPYIDADLVPERAAAALPADRFTALLDLVRRGRPVPEADLGQLDAERLRLLRNAAYARHGYRFKSKDLRDYFAASGWYRPDPGFTPADLQPVDVEAIARIKSHERRASVTAAARPTKASKPVDVGRVAERARKGEAIAEADLAGLNLRQLRLVRNASYARHGYRFRSSDLRAHFEAQPWYRPDSAYDPNRLTPVDAANVQRVKAREKALLSRGGDALRDFELRSRARAHEALR